MGVVTVWLRPGADLAVLVDPDDRLPSRYVAELDLGCDTLEIRAGLPDLIRLAEALSAAVQRAEREDFARRNVRPAILPLKDRGEP